MGFLYKLQVCLDINLRRNKLVFMSKKHFYFIKNLSGLLINVGKPLCHSLHPNTLSLLHFVTPPILFISNKNFDVFIKLLFVSYTYSGDNFM